MLTGHIKSSDELIRNTEIHLNWPYWVTISGWFWCAEMFENHGVQASSMTWSLPTCRFIFPFAFLIKKPPTCYRTGPSMPGAVLGPMPHLLPILWIIYPYLCFNIPLKHCLLQNLLSIKRNIPTNEQFPFPWSPRAFYSSSSSTSSLHYTETISSMSASALAHLRFWGQSP